MAKFDKGKGLPCCWAFLPNKKEETYEKMWDCIMSKVDKNGTEQHQPAHLVIDFESAMIKNLRSRFASVPVVGCLFHFRQAVWRKLQEIGLTPLFFRDADFQEWIHMVYALCYVPLDSLVTYYESVILQRLEDKINHPSLEDQPEDQEEEQGDDDGSWPFWQDEIQFFVAYIDRTWIGRKQASRGKTQERRRGKPMMSHDVWNQVQVITENDDQETGSHNSTNNTVERYNRTMKLLLGANPNLWKTMQSLVSQEAETRSILMHNAAGLDISVNAGRKQQLKDISIRLKNIVSRFHDLSPEMYLQTLASHLNTSY
jgi:hypothetical protein